MLTHLSFDPNENVRASVVWNPNTPTEVVSKLLGDTIGTVASAAWRSIVFRDVLRTHDTQCTLNEFDECIGDWTITALSDFGNHLADLWTPQHFRSATPIFFTGCIFSWAGTHIVVAFILPAF